MLNYLHVVLFPGLLHLNLPSLTLFDCEERKGENKAILAIPQGIRNFTCQAT